MTRPHPVLTLLVATLVFAGGLVLGLRLLTASGDPIEVAPTCTERTVEPGEPLTANLLQVNVLNASGREGLANRANINLQRKGFLGGSIANSTSEVEVSNVAILTTTPEDPRVQLVAQQFVGEVTFAEPDIPLDDGVTVIIGAGYESIDDEAPTEIGVDEALSLCVPIVELE